MTASDTGMPARISLLTTMTSSCGNKIRNQSAQVRTDDAADNATRNTKHMHNPLSRQTVLSTHGRYSAPSAAVASWPILKVLKEGLNVEGFGSCGSLTFRAGATVCVGSE